jgi:Na+/H+ antiporter NhaC
MSDKFTVNSWIVVPVAILTMFVYFFMSTETPASVNMLSSDLYKVIPYLLVITIAIIGLNVMTVLFLGILSTGIIGVIDGSYDIFGWFKSLSDGMLGMSELIIMTLLATAMLTLIRHNGGISFIISKLTHSIKGRKGAGYCIAALVSFVNVCTANNTVAIMTVGSIAADISKRYGIDKRLSASILDTASCFTQGLLPYGAQILIASSMAGVTPFSIIPYLFYPMMIGVALIVSIWFNYPGKYVGK